MKRGMWALAAVAAFVAGGAVAQATTITDANVLADGQGWFDGTGNPNGGFTVESNVQMELGLRAKYRHNPNVIHPTGPMGNVYVVVPGPETDATSGHNGTSSRTAWNYEFSISVPPGFSALVAYDFRLTVSDGTNSATVDPLAYWGDNAGYGSSGKDGSAQPGDWVAQNSENPSFADFPLNGVPGYSGFNMNAPGIYTFTLEAFTKGDVSPAGLIASDQIQVNVVPLPASAWGGMVLLGGLALAKRRTSVVVPA